MKHERSVQLSSKTTLRIGGVADSFYTPEGETELAGLALDLSKQGDLPYVLSGGSNLLICDYKTFPHVVSMAAVDSSIADFGEGRFYIGASNKMQKVIRYVNARGFGGFEDLFRLPALFGGIICMNAGTGGRGREVFNISQFVLRVRAMDVETGEIKWLSADECCFTFRDSIFRRGNYFILGAEIQCEAMSRDASARAIKARLLHCRQTQEWSKGCFGSCFSEFSPALMRLAWYLRSQRGGIRFTRRNPNWLNNDGTGTFDDAISLVHHYERVHRVFGKTISREVVVWD